MKKILFAVAMLAAFTAQSFAGPNFGINLSYQSEAMIGDNTEYFADDQVSSAEAIGLGVLIPFNPMFSLHTGLDFQINIYSYSMDGYGDDVDMMNLFLNFQIPVLARINFTPGFFAEAGLDMQLNMLSQHYNDASEEWDDIEDWSAFGVGPSAGLGYTLWFGLEFSARYSYGLIAAYDENDNNWHPMRFQFDITYWFGYRR